MISLLRDLNASGEMLSDANVASGSDARPYMRKADVWLAARMSLWSSQLGHRQTAGTEDW